jgi:hypothetical protein
MRTVVVIAMAVLMSCTLLAQTKEVPPPPKPGDDGPGLEATMRFIQEKLNGQGAIGFVFTRGDIPATIFRTSYRISDAVADGAACSLHTVETTDIKIEVTAGENYSEQSVDTGAISFKDVENLRVEPGTDATNRDFAQNAHPEIGTTFTPNVFYLTLVASKPVFTYHIVRTKGKEPAWTSERPPSKEFHLIFGDEEIAKRLAKAITHAVELCGGGNQDPF